MMPAFIAFSFVNGYSERVFVLNLSLISHHISIMFNFIHLNDC